MRIKSFYGDTMRAALDLVKKELGPNALILSSKQVKKPPVWGYGNKIVYEVTAALEDPMDGGLEPVPSYTEASHPVPSGPSEGSGMHELKNELGELRRLIHSLERPFTTPANLFPDATSYEIYHTLISNDVNELLAYKIVDGARSKLSPDKRLDKAALAQTVKALLCDMVMISPIEEGKPDPQGVRRQIALLIGPTGVGKTTTIAKLAARYALEKRLKVLLVTLDTYRIAAIDQLKVYAGIIGVPLEVASTVQELDRAIKQNSDKDIVLIDSAGCSQRDVARMNDLAAYLQNASDIQRHLVLSATTKPIDLHEIIEKFGLFAPNKLLFTKLDETSTFGPILNELVRTNKPLSYFTNGQKVPEDLGVPTSRQVAELIVNAN